MPLNVAQKSAVEYLDGPLLVLAGPGTGKTQLLSAKVQYILEHTDANPDNILCLTFTEAGAANMRTRLFSFIGRAASRVNIHTYHAFGSDLLAKYKNYAENYSRALDESVSTVAQHKIIRSIIETLPATDILKSANVSDVIDTIKSVKSARLTAEDLAIIAKTNSEMSAELSSELSPIFAKQIPRMKFQDALAEVFLPVMEVLTKYTSERPIVGNIEPIANSLLRSLSQVIESEQGADRPSVGALSEWRRDYFEKDSAESFRLKDFIANKKLASMAVIMRKYSEHLLENGWYDFSDMIEESIKILKQDEGFRAQLSETYQFIMLDEFQDTNPSQFELIRLITDYEKPNVMAVGDDDQAIFAFQGANASNLIDFQSHYAAKVITLTENYRSTAEILDFSHKIAEQIPDSFAKQHNIDKVLSSVLNDKILQGVGAGETLIHRHEFVSSHSEYDWLAGEIYGLIRAGEAQSDIAIITPQHKYIAPLLPYLKAYPEINIAYEKRENILEDGRIYQLTTLARFIYELGAERSPSHQLLEIVAFPFWGISPFSAICAIQRARQDKKSALEYLASAEDEKLQQLSQFLANLVAVSYDTPLELFVDYLVGSAELKGFRSPFLQYYTDVENQEVATFELYENLAVLAEAVNAYTKAPRLKLADLIQFLDDYTEAGEAILNTSPYQDSTSAVQILTAHKSKGLEFKHVFIVATDNLAWGKAKGNNNTLTLPKNLIQIRHTNTTDSEKLRLFFVAITRAKKSLTLTNSLQDFSGKSPDRLLYLDEHLVEEDGEKYPISPLLPRPKIQTHYEDLDMAKRKTDLRKSWIASYNKLTPELLPILKKRMEGHHLTATNLTTFVDVIYAGPMEFYKNVILRAPQEPADEKLVYGNLVHATFEAVTKQGLADEGALDFYREQVEKATLPARETADLLEKGLYQLTIFLRTFGALLRAHYAKAEVDFHREHLFYKDIPITGKIDHLQIDNEAKTIEIYDFKTTEPKDKKWEAHPSLFKHALQLEFYKLLLKSSATYKDYTVKNGHILFVSPDKDGRVADKVYNFTAESERNFLKLVESVYARITSLDFLENDELALYADKNRTIKDLRAFVELLEGMK